jgi:hypothetical protein
MKIILRFLYINLILLNFVLTMEEGSSSNPGPRTQKESNAKKDGKTVYPSIETQDAIVEYYKRINRRFKYIYEIVLNAENPRSTLPERIPDDNNKEDSLVYIFLNYFFTTEY